MPSVKTARVNPFSPKGLIFLLVRSLHRFLVSGQSITGRRTDNASFLHAATKDHRDKPIERLSGPIWQRLARRWSVAGIPLLLLGLGRISAAAHFLARSIGFETPWYLAIPWARIALWWEITALCIVVGFGVMIGQSWWKNRTAISEFIYPTWQAASATMAIAYHKRDARKNVELPEGFEIEEEEDDADKWPKLAILLKLTHSNSALGRILTETEKTAETALDEPTPGTEIEVRRPSIIARYRGRRLDAESQVPAADPEPPPVRVYLIPGKITTEAQRKLFVTTVSAPLGLPDAKAVWYAKGKRPYVELRPNLLPPPVLNFTQAKRYIERATLAQPFMGLAAGNKLISIDLESNSPHTAASGGSGTGKSVLLKNFLAQRMHNGTGTLMLDYKRVSHRWMHNLPGCVYAWRLADIHDSLIAASEELNRRLENILPEDNSADAEMIEFSPVDVVVEEINSTIKLLQMYWTVILDNKGPSPAIIALMTLVNMGRELNMYLWVAAQRLSANVFGPNGGDLRESFQTRLMAKWTVQTWKMLAGNTPYQRPQGGRGVWARVQDDELEIVRVPFWTDREAREWAMSGVACPDTPDVLPNRGLSGLSDVRDMRGAVDLAPELVTLSAALTRLPPDNKGRQLTIEGLRTAAKKNGFPVPHTPGGPGRPGLYAFDALVEWKQNRDGFAEIVEQFDRPSARTGIVYAADTLDPISGQVEIGYIGQTRRTLPEREAEHRGDKPWGDLIVGSFRVIWAGDPTDAELDAIEMRFIKELCPRYNIDGQKGAAHAVPKWDQITQRHARDDALSRDRWVPVDVFHGERRTEIVETWRWPGEETSREDPQQT